MSTQEKNGYIAIMADQLIAICRDAEKGFSDADDERVRTIGWNLNKRGGFDAMSGAHQIVKQKLGAVLAYDVERAWHGLGNWLL